MRHKTRLIEFVIILMAFFFLAGCESPDADDDNGENPFAPAITGGDCVSTGSVTVTETIHVADEEVYNGECKTYNAAGLGQAPVFRVENGGELKNVIIGDDGAGGIHLYNDAILDNITFQDVGETAVTVKSEGNYVLLNIEGYDAENQFLRIDAPCNLALTNGVIHRAGKALRQKEDTDFKIAVAFYGCEIEDMEDGIFRTDSSSSTALIMESRLSNAGNTCIGKWTECKALYNTQY